MFRLNDRGDTLVEVLLATVVLSIVIAGAYNLSNRATRINQQAFERTQVSNLLQEQAEYLRAARDSNTAATGEAWDQVQNYLRAGYSGFQCDVGDVTTISSLSPIFHMTSSGGTLNVNNTEMVHNNLFYIWVEGVSTGAGSSYIDFTVNGCWQGIGSDINQQSGIVIRLERT